MIDLSQINEAVSSSSGFVRLVDDGDKVTFFIPSSSVLRERWTMWAGGTSKDVDKGTTGATQKMLTDVAVTSENGKALAAPTFKLFEAKGKVWDSIGKETKKNGGSLHDHVFEVERIGEKNDKQTKYRVKVVGKAADYQVPPTGDAANAGRITPPPADPKAELMALIVAAGLKPVVVAAAIQGVVPGKSLPGALTTDEAAKVVAALRG